MLSERKLGDVTVVDAVYVAGAIDPYHAHDFAQLSLLLSGEALEVRGTTVERKRFRAASSQRRGGSHVIFFPVETRIVSLTAASLRSLERSSLDRLLDMSDVHNSASVRQLLRKTKQPLTHLSAAPLWLRRIVQAFPWASNVPLREASEGVGVHPSHFARSFHQHLRMSPRAFRRRAKLRAASRWLLTTTLPPAHVALECGFSDQSHLTAAFSAAYGIPPVRFRQIFAQSS